MYDDVREVNGEPSCENPHYINFLGRLEKEDDEDTDLDSKSIKALESFVKNFKPDPNIADLGKKK